MKACIIVFLVFASVCAAIPSHKTKSHHNRQADSPGGLAPVPIVPDDMVYPMDIYGAMVSPNGAVGNFVFHLLGITPVTSAILNLIKPAGKIGQVVDVIFGKTSIFGTIITALVKGMGWKPAMIAIKTFLGSSLFGSAMYEFNQLLKVFGLLNLGENGLLGATSITTTMGPDLISWIASFDVTPVLTSVTGFINQIIEIIMTALMPPVPPAPEMP